jgi:hypothetical protein
MHALGAGSKAGVQAATAWISSGSDDDSKAKRPEIMEYLRAENAYTDAVLAPTQALQDKLAKRPTHAEKPWMKFAGIAANDPEMVEELRRIQQIVDENFEQIDEEEWK